MVTELTFAILKYAFLILMWVFVWLVVRSLNRDVNAISPRKSRKRRRKDKQAQKAVNAPAPAARPLRSSANNANAFRRHAAPNPNASEPTLLVIIDGPLAGTSISLADAPITLGRAASNTVVLNDEFVSSHHARVYHDPTSNAWAIEDLHSTNGTVVNQQRISAPTILAARVPVRIGATTFELR